MNVLLLLLSMYLDEVLTGGSDSATSEFAIHICKFANLDNTELAIFAALIDRFATARHSNK